MGCGGKKDANSSTGRARRDQLLAPANVLWIDLREPTAEEKSLVFEQFFNIHSLSLKDAASPMRRRIMASDLMQTYLSAQSNHLNQIMKVLTKTSTIVLPMALIAGIYGMNFELFLPHEGAFFIALGAMMVSGAISLAYFYWRRWL